MALLFKFVLYLQIFTPTGNQICNTTSFLDYTINLFKEHVHRFTLSTIYQERVLNLHEKCSRPVPIKLVPPGDFVKSFIEVMPATSPADILQSTCLAFDKNLFLLSCTFTNDTLVILLFLLVYNLVHVLELNYSCSCMQRLVVAERHQVLL